SRPVPVVSKPPGAEDHQVPLHRRRARAVGELLEWDWEVWSGAPQLIGRPTPLRRLAPGVEGISHCKFGALELRPELAAERRPAADVVERRSVAVRGKGLAVGHPCRPGAAAD